MEYHIRTEHLSKKYSSWFSRKSVAALNDLTIEVPAGSVMGFLGKNGAGKTTTVKILLGLIKATAGHAEVMGKEVGDRFSRKEVTYMPELPALDANDNAWHFLQLIGKVSGMSTDAISSRIPVVLEEVGLAGKEKVRFREFSKGMKQRVELAQALFTSPRLLILDEPFSGLDPSGRREIRDLIVRYNQEYGTTVFFSSHILADVEVMCDSIGVLDCGELKALGQKDDLLGVESIEISGEGIDPTGIMFLEKMGERSAKNKDRFSVFLAPKRESEKVVQLFNKYGAKDVRVEKHCRNLESFFMDMTGSPPKAEDS